MKKLRKSVNICQSYRKNKRGTFFYGPLCILLNSAKNMRRFGDMQQHSSEG